MKNDGIGNSRKKAIRAKCLDCCCDSAQEVRLCPAEDCPLWPFRMGTRIGGKGDEADDIPDEERGEELPVLP